MTLLIASIRETEVIAKKVAKELNAQFCKINLSKFPDGEFLVKLQNDPKGKTVVIIASLAQDPNNELIETILAAGAARDSGAKKVILFATYLPYMRQDKIFHSYEGVSAKSILTTLSEKFDTVFAIDPHLHRIKSLQDIARNCHSVSTINLIADYVKKNLKHDFMLVGPDAESKQWDKSIAQILDKKAVILQKTRFSSEKVSIKSEPIENKNILIIDDIISTGHTILEAVKIAKKQAAKKVTVIGIHGLLLHDSGKKIAKVAELVTTNTIPNKYAKIDVAPLIISTLRNIK